MDDDLLQYVEEMIEMINTEDEKVNEDNMNLLVDQIAAKLEEMHGKDSKHAPAKSAIRRFLQELKEQALSEEDPNQMDDEAKAKRKKQIQNMAESFYNLGSIGFYATS